MDERNNLYSLFKKYSYSDLKDLFKNAKTKFLYVAFKFFIARKAKKGHR